MLKGYKIYQVVKSILASVGLSQKVTGIVCYVFGLQYLTSQWYTGNLRKFQSIKLDMLS